MQRLLMSLLLLTVAAGAWIVSDNRNSDELLPLETTNVAPATPLLSARRVPEYLSLPEANSVIEAGLQNVANRSPELSCLVVRDGPAELFSLNPEVALIPASNQKIVTATAALFELGSARRFETTVVTNAPIVDGVVQGNVYLVGGGDPVLMTADYAATFPPPSPPFTDLGELATAVVDAGVTQIQGGVYGDESRYDQERFPAVWGDQYAGQVVAGPLGALMVNGAFTTYPEEQTEDAPPPVPAGDPAIHAAATFDDLLEAQGVVIAAGSRNEVAPEDAEVLASIKSPPLRRIVGFMMTHSDNAAAELLTKEMGVSRFGEGSTSQGVLAMLEVIGEQGISIDSIFPTDGSGLALNDRLSCDAIIDILDFAGPTSDLAAAMPVAGESGTLRRRFNNTDAAGRVYAKTGSLNGVTALSGWIDTLPGKTLSFAYVVNTESVDDELLRLQRILVEQLVQYPIGPPVEELEPLPVGADPVEPYDGPDRAPVPPTAPGEPGDEGEGEAEAGEGAPGEGGAGDEEGGAGAGDEEGGAGGLGPDE